MTVYKTVSPVFAGLISRMRENPGGSTHPVSSKQPAKKIEKNRSFIRIQLLSYFNAGKCIYTILKGE